MKKYIIAILIGLAIMPKAHEIATMQRGYVAYGGEILLVPLFIVLIVLWEQMKEMFEEFKNL